MTCLEVDLSIYDIRKRKLKEIIKSGFISAKVRKDQLILKFNMGKLICSDGEMGDLTCVTMKDKRGKSFKQVIDYVRYTL